MSFPTSAAKQQQPSLDYPAMMLALDAADIGLWNYTPTTGIIDIRHRSSVIPAETEGRFLGPLMALARHVMPEDQGVLSQFRQDCLFGLPKVRANLRIMSRQRQFAWFSLVGQRLNSAGGPPRYVGALMDVTYSKMREIGLKLHQDALFELARNPIVVNCSDFGEAATYVIKRALTVLDVSCASYWRFDTERKASI